MSKFIDLTGQRFNRLTVVKRTENNGNKTMWLCKCDCGNEVAVTGGNLKNGHTGSCGCRRNDTVLERQLTTLIGKKVNRLIVIGIHGKRGIGRTLLLCKCDCGNEAIVSISDLNNGNTKSCGCLKKEITIERNKTHGFTGNAVHDVWRGMKSRCYNKNNHAYKDYGGRGIRVCDEWLNDFTLYYDWAIKNGYRKGLTIDRIENDGNYEPSNCRWSTMLEQANNKRNNCYLTVNGITKTVPEWAREVGIKSETLKQRFKYGHREKDLLKPVRKGNYGKKNMCPCVEQG